MPPTHAIVLAFTLVAVVGGYSLWLWLILRSFLDNAARFVRVDLSGRLDGEGL